MSNLSNEYIKSMLVGITFTDAYEECEAVDDWSASEECATIARLCSHVSDVIYCPVSTVVTDITNLAIVNGFEVEDHGWDDYTRGFLAGEMAKLAGITSLNETVDIANLAEDVWKSEEFGYYQEAVSEVIRRLRDEQKK